MPLLGQAAMLLTFDVSGEALAEHDDWHTHEHLPERLSIPGFLRGTRWVAAQGRPPRYLVIYEVAQLATLASDAYLLRLNNPSRWTTKMMAHYQGMKRGLCSVTASFGLGVGHAGLLIRLRASSSDQASMRLWLAGQVFPQLVSQPGIGSAHLLETALAPPMTNEQRIRGADSGIDWAIFVTGYGPASVAAIAENDLSAARLAERGALDVQHASYRIDYSLVDAEVGA